MRAAIYARKSNDQNNRNEDAKSVTRQIERSRAYIAKKGWTVVEDCIYSDDAISGAEFVNRHGFTRLMLAVAAKPRPAFQVLVTMDEDRLGRESIETGWNLKKLIVDAGVRVFYYLKDQERTLGSAQDKVMMHLATFTAETEREKAKLRTYDTMARKARAGHVCGGKTYGYRNTDVLGPDGKRSHVRRVVVPEQAAVIVRIFEMAANGKGLVRIAKALNAERIPSPTGSATGWAPAALRAMLYRDAYRGVTVWNKMARVDKDGQTGKRRKRPESEWLTLPVNPELRIVSEALWLRTHARIEQTRAAYLRTTNGRVWGRPETGIESAYLLTGLSACAVCGGSLFVRKRPNGKAKTGKTTTTGAHRPAGDDARSYYGCSYHHHRGVDVCANGLQMRMDDADAEVLSVLSEDILNPQAIARAIETAVARYAGRPEDLDRDTAQAQADLATVQAEITRGLGMVVKGLASEDELAETLKDARARRAALQARLEHLDGLSRVPRIDTGALAAELRARVDEWRALLKAEPVKARQILRKLITGRLVFEPDPERREYRFRGETSYGRLLAGLVHNGACPRGDSNTRHAV